MATHIISVDAGNGGTNGVKALSNGRYRSVYFPSVRAAATGDSLGLGPDMEMAYDYFDWGGHRYIVGDDVLRVTRRHLERHRGAERYGNELQRFLVAVACAELGVRNGTVDLTLFAPPGLYIEARRDILSRFQSDTNVAMIQKRSDKKVRRWEYEQITVYPEGIGAAACFALDSKGRPTSSDVLEGEVIVLDMGVFTLDALQMTDGNFNPESLAHATWDAGGLGVHILEPVLRQVKKAHSDFAQITTDDIDAVIRQGLDEGDWVVTAGGQSVDIQPAVQKYAERFAGWIANNIVDGVFNGLKGIKSCIIVGGGATLVDEHLRGWYGDKILDPRDHPATRNIHPVEMNVVGGLRIALARALQPA